MDKKGLLIVISGPSGAGKGTIYNSVTEKLPHLKKSISVTTRKPRPNEVDGVHYHFKTLTEYQQMIAKGEFLETAAVFDNYYGTLRGPVFDLIDKGEDIMFEVDVLGAKQIKSQYPECLTIFIMTTDFKDLEARLRRRNTESEDSIKTRLGGAKRELGNYKMFDYIVFNDRVDNAVNDVINIIRAERCSIARNENIIKQLLN